MSVFLRALYVASNAAGLVVAGLIVLIACELAVAIGVSLVVMATNVLGTP